MKSYHFLAAGILLSSPLAGAGITHQPGTFFSAEDLGKLRQTPAKEDLMVLNDGTTLQGEIPRLPELKSRLGVLPLRVQDVAAAAISHSSGNPKIQLLTREGFIFVCDAPDERVALVQHYPSRHAPNQEIDLQTVSYILLKERGANLVPYPRNLYSLELKNGDRFPVVMRDDVIRLSNGWRDIRLLTRNIVDVRFDGGIYGTVKGEDGSEVEIDFAFVKDNHLGVQIARGGQMIGVPWEQIDRVHAENPAAGTEKRHPASESPKKIFSANSWNEKDYDVSWVDEPPHQAYSNEIAEAAVQPGREEFPSAGRMNDLKHRLVSMENRNLEFQQEFEKLKSFAHRADRENLELKQKVSHLHSTRDELLTLQGSLVANLELELTRTRILRDALNELMGKWNDVRRYSNNLEERMHKLREEKGQDEAQLKEYETAFEKLQAIRESLEEQRLATGDFDEQLSALTASLEEERDRHQQTKAALAKYQNRAETHLAERAQGGASADEADSLRHALMQEKEQVKQLSARLEQMSKESNSYREKFIAVKKAIEGKYLEIIQLQDSQGKLYTQLMTKLQHAAKEKDHEESLRLELEKELKDLQAAKLDMEREFAGRLDELAAGMDRQKDNSDELEAVITRLLESVQIERNRAETLESSLQEMQSSTDSLRAEYTDLQLDFERQSDSLMELQNLLEEKNEQLAHFENYSTTLDQRMQELNRELADSRNLSADLSRERDRAGSLECSLKEAQCSSESLRADYAGLKADFERQSDSLMELQNLLEEKNQQLANLETYSSGLEEKMQELTQELVESRDQSADFADSLSSVRIERDKVLQEKTVLKESLSEFEALLAEEKIRADRLEGLLDEKNLELSRLRGVTDRLEEKIHLLTEDQEDLRADNAQLAEKLSISKEESDHLQETLLKREQEWLQARNAHEAVRQELSELIEGLQTSLEEEKERSLTFERKLQEAHEELAVSRTEKDSLEELVRSLQENLKTAEGKHERLAREFSDKRNSLIGEVQDLKKRVQKEHSGYLQLSAELENVSTDNEGLLRQKGEVERNLSKMMESLSQKENELIALQEGLSRKDAEYKDFENTTTYQINTLSQRIQELVQELQEKEQHSSRLEEELKASTVQYRELQQEMSSGRKNLLKLEGESKSAISELKSSLEELKQELNEERNKTRELRKKIERSQQEMDQSEREKEQLERDLQSARQRLKETEQEFSKGVDALQEKEKELEFLTSSRKSLENDLQKKLDVMYAKIRERDQRMDSLERQNAELKQAKEGASGDIQRLESELEVSRERLDRLQNELTGTTALVVAKQNEIDALTIAQSQLQSGLSDRAGLMQKKLEEEVGKVEALKGHLTSLLPKYDAEREKSLQMETQLRTLNTHLSRLREALGRSEEQNQVDREKLSSALDDNQQLLKERESLVNQLRREKDELNAQKNKIKRLTESLNSQKAAISNIERSHLNLVTELENAREQYRLPEEERLNTSEVRGKADPGAERTRSEYGYKDVHIVADGENLNNISMRYYGTPYRWSDIYEANVDVIPDVNRIKVGTALVIPD